MLTKQLSDGPRVLASLDLRKLIQKIAVVFYLHENDVFDETIYGNKKISYFHSTCVSSPWSRW